MEIRLRRQPSIGRDVGPAVPEPEQLVQGQLVELVAAAPKRLDRGDADRQVVTVERQGARRFEIRRILHQAAFDEPEKDRVRVVGRQEAAVLGGGGDGRSGSVLDLDEDAVKPGPLVLAAVDPQGQPLAEAVEFPDLDGGAERARAKVEPQAFIAIVGIGLDVADDRHVQEHQRDRISVRHAQ